MFSKPLKNKLSFPDEIKLELRMLGDFEAACFYFTGVCNVCARKSCERCTNTQQRIPRGRKVTLHGVLVFNHV